jgi:prefoldin subunit 5
VEELKMQMNENHQKELQYYIHKYNDYKKKHQQIQQSYQALLDLHISECKHYKQKIQQLEEDLKRVMKIWENVKR